MSSKRTAADRTRPCFCVFFIRKLAVRHESVQIKRCTGLTNIDYNSLYDYKLYKKGK